jgi:hypothetical protein
LERQKDVVGDDDDDGNGRTIGSWKRTFVFPLRIPRGSDGGALAIVVVVVVVRALAYLKVTIAMPLWTFRPMPRSRREKEVSEAEQ